MVKASNFQTQQADLAFARRMMKEPLLTREREQFLARRWRDQQDEDALHKLVTPYARLVISIAVRFRHHGLPVGDLIQEGNMGLMMAAERFDPDREVRFSTYAKWWIRSCIQEYILRNWSIVRTGSTTAQKQLFFNLRRLRAQISSLTTETMAPEHREEIATILNVTISDVEEMEKRLSGHDLSLSTPKTIDGDGEWIDSLVDDRDSPEHIAMNTHDDAVRERWVEEALQCLDPRERVILMARRLTEYPMTLAALAQKMKISKERVRQLEVRAIRKLRHRLLGSINEARSLFSEPSEGGRKKL